MGSAVLETLPRNLLVPGKQRIRNIYRLGTGDRAPDFKYYSLNCQSRTHAESQSYPSVRPENDQL